MLRSRDQVKRPRQNRLDTNNLFMTNQSFNALTFDKFNLLLNQQENHVSSSVRTKKDAATKPASTTETPDSNMRVIKESKTQHNWNTRGC